MTAEKQEHMKRITERILSRGQGSISIGHQPSVTHTSVTLENNQLFEFLWDKGYKVQKIGDHEETHYLIVSAVTPKDTQPIAQDIAS